MSTTLPAPLADQAIAARLGRYGRFGVHLGLGRIRVLLAALGNPQEQVPIIHVGGTNGKGSVCAYLSAILAQAGYKVGRYTSPHLVSWCERICINDRPIAPTDLETSLTQVEAAIDPQADSPTQFEVLTAAAWVYFAQEKVDVAVIEVGLGGRLDATNVCDRPLVSIITSLSREHWQRLGPTLADIAREKAGILKAGCPAVVGPLPAEAQAVVAERIQALNCPVIYPEPAQPLGQDQAEYPSEHGSLCFRLPLQGQYQYTNVALAITALQTLQQQGWAISDRDMAEGIAAARWPGRLQWLTWHDPHNHAHTLLVDGAHNPAAALVLRQYVDTLPGSSRACSWVMGMLDTKDHGDILAALLRPGDYLHLLPVPEHQSAAPETLAAIAQHVCPDLNGVHCHGSLETALAEAVQHPNRTVLCGSLYLVGHCFATQAGRLKPLTALASRECQP
ncbi:MAG: bifunctional folylpolyglutamate synthase/dihydrofolate synthase [Cyanobacteria bacterium]|nr:bifunctional folylpolyglutamate synthase/dihydrofolate synthase [Cyanobacteriota bacterium]MDA0865269.1 bifunctional folylpolyglutamate synthase/dihydrofolate synthase [Cyanobacteriota bacterium]